MQELSNPYFDVCSHVSSCSSSALFSLHDFRIFSFTVANCMIRLPELPWTTIIPISAAPCPPEPKRTSPRGCRPRRPKPSPSSNPRPHTLPPSQPLSCCCCVGMVRRCALAVPCVLGAAHPARATNWQDDPKRGGKPSKPGIITETQGGVSH